MPSRWTLLLALTTSMLAGCLFQNLSPTETLSDQIYGLNEETRWGRIDLAVARVSPEYRTLFVTSRRAWGRRISVADAEVSAVTLAPDSESATSSVEITWYDLQAMELRTTMVRQTWARTGGGYVLDEETIVDGDEELLDLPDEDEDEDEEDGEGTQARAEPQRG